MKGFRYYLIAAALLAVMSQLWIFRLTPRASEGRSQPDKKVQTVHNSERVVLEKAAFIRDRYLSHSENRVKHEGLADALDRVAIPEKEAFQRRFEELEADNKGLAQLKDELGKALLHGNQNHLALGLNAQLEAKAREIHERQDAFNAAYRSLVIAQDKQIKDRFNLEH